MPKNIAIYSLGLATFVTFLSAQLITPIVPVLARILGAEDLSIMTVSSSHIVFMALFHFVSGALADRYGRKRIIVSGAFLAALSSLLCVVISSWEHLLILRAVGGIADAIAGPALLALVVELSGDEKGRAMGIFRSSQGLAYVFGPVLGGVIAHFFSIYTPFYVDFSLTIIGILLFLFLVPEIKREQKELTHIALNSLKFIRNNLKLLKIAFLGFSETFGFATLLSVVPAIVIGQGMSEVETATLLTVQAIIFTLTSFGVGTLSDRIGRKPIIFLGLVFSATIFVAFFYAIEFWQILLLMAFYGFGSTSVYLMSSTMAADILPDENRATLFGAFDALMDLGMVIGPSISFTFLAISGLPIHYAFIVMLIPTIIGLGLIFQMKETKVKGATLND